MDEQAAETSKFWTFIGKRSNAEAALADWRMELDGEIDFDQLQRSYLMPTGRMAEVIKCPFTCNSSCGFRNVRAYDGEYEAVCREWPLKSYCIGKADALFHTVKESALVEEVAKALSITPYMAKLSNHEHSWKVGNIIVRGESHSVFFTLQWDTELLELILDLNRLMHNPYVLLGASGRMYNNVVAGCLANGDAIFVPLNETLDFNQDAELEQMRPFSWEKLLLTPEALNEEPGNIFRKCGDAWEIRFDGGEKFMLTGADTGARYIHFMLGRSGGSTPVTEIMLNVFGEPDISDSQKRLGKDELACGYSISNLPYTIIDSIVDDAAIKQYRRKMIELADEITEARNHGDNVTAQMLLEDFKKLASEVQKVTSANNQNRRLNDPLRKIDNSFRNAVNRTIMKIADYDNDMATHLKHSISCGMNPIYHSKKSINWIV